MLAAVDEVAWTRSGRDPAQIKSELDAFIELMLRHKARSYLEIGARWGDSFYAIMTALPIGSQGVVVDMPGGMWGRRKSLRSLNAAATELRERGYDIHVILGNSRDPEIVREVRALGPYGAIFIDGDHRYEGVKRDWLNYRKLSRLVAFHDIVGEGQKTKKGIEVDVPRLWAELKEKHATIEFVAPDSRMGIGVVIR